MLHDATMEVARSEDWAIIVKLYWKTLRIPNPYTCLFLWDEVVGLFGEMMTSQNVGFFYHQNGRILPCSKVQDLLCDLHVAFYFLPNFNSWGEADEQDAVDP